MESLSASRRIAATLLLIAGVLPIGYGCQRQAEPPGAVVGGSLERIDGEIDYDVVPAQTGISEAAARIAEAVQEESGNGPESQLSELPAELIAALESYLDGSLASFQSYCLERGLDISWVDQASEYPEFDQLWELRSQTLRGARMSTANVVLRPRFIAGKETVYTDQTSMITAERPDRAPWIQNPVEQQLDVYEVLIPTELMTQEKEKFPGRIGLTFVWDTEFTRWLLWKLTLYDVRAGMAISMPPL